MRPAKLLLALSLALLGLSACGSINVKPTGEAGQRVSRGKVDDPRTTKVNHVECLRGANLAVTEIGANKLQIGTWPSGPTVLFTPTAGAAQADQIQGVRWAQGAEVIGSALLFPNQAPDSQLSAVESCIAQGVAG
jgi:hypothetical protein